MNPKEINFRFDLKPGEDKIIKEITESVHVFYDFEVDVAHELAVLNIEKGPGLSGYNFILSELDSRVIGYTCYGNIPCTKNRFDLFWIVVSNEYRGKNIGKQLLHETEKKVAEKNGKKIYIETSSREPYYGTRKFYENCGYRIDAIQKDYYDNEDDKVIYVKDIMPDNLFKTITNHIN